MVNMLSYIQCNFLPKFWQSRGIANYLLLPFSAIYRLIIWLRRCCWRYFPPAEFSAPVIVVGNITVGGTGKTPMVVFLAELLKGQGYTPGIVSRGYGRKNKSCSITVSSESNPDDVGDEALLIARRVNCQVLVDINRSRAVKKLLEVHGCNAIISDDGLQHYALARNLEIVMVDAEFKFGNKFCLPAGPLREPLSRLKEVDFIVNLDNKYSMVLEPVVFRNVVNPDITKAIDDFKGQTAHAVAGIGIPAKFFQGLRRLDLAVIEHPFPDHYQFSKEDLLFTDKIAKIIIMTEKDAVKCDKIAPENCWYLEVQAKPNQGFTDEFLRKLQHYS